MRLGSSTMFLRERPVTEALEVLARAGFQAAEVWVEHVWSGGEAPERIRQRARELGLVLTVHAASYDLNVSSTNQGIRRESMRQMEESLQIASELGVAVVVMHPGRLSSSRGSVEQAWPMFLENLAFLDERAAGLGLRLAVESMEKKAREFFVHPEDLERLYERPWRSTGLTVDLAHARGLMDPLEYLALVPPSSLFHVHLSDSAPGKTHLPLGLGDLDVGTVLARLQCRYDGLVILEGYVPGCGEETVAANAAYLCSLGWLRG